MPVQPTYPGVYVQEIPSGVRTIAGVATSIGAFIGYFKRGPMNTAVQIFNLGDFERIFGGLDSDSEAAYAIRQFFLNGGTQAFVVRVAGGNPRASTATIADSTPVETFRIAAKDPGDWGDNIRVKVDHNTPIAGEFNLIASEYDDAGNVARQEAFLGQSKTDGATNNVETVINDEFAGSTMITIENNQAAGIPVANGTVSDQHGDITAVVIQDANPDLEVLIDGNSVGIALLGIPADSYDLNDLAIALENAIRSVDPTNTLLAGATVNVVVDRLQVYTGSGDPRAVITFGANAGNTMADLGLDTVTANAQEYILGVDGTGLPFQLDHATAPGTEGGNNGSLPDAPALRGLQNSKTGIYALEDVDLFNILNIPYTATDNGTTFDSVHSEAIVYCENRRAFYLIDTPNDIDTLSEIKKWRNAKGSLIRSKNAALYFPQVQISDPLDDGRMRSVGPGGTVAGLYARIDSNRGVWKAPAGTEATLRNVSRLTYTLTDAENGVLNPIGINCLRTFPVYGTICWGARTTEGADALASEWKYVPVRRLTLFMEESLYRGLHWAVFEPNDEPLWAQIRLNVGAFMNNLFRQGAFQGTSPRDAYLVKCDSETTTQNDINNGIVNIVVGFAPLKPAEFVFIKIKQLAGQVQS